MRGPHKTCTKCGVSKPRSDFYRLKDRKNYPDGRDCRCKECRRQEKREEYARNRKVPDGLLSRDGRTIEHRGASLKIYWGEERTKDFRRLYPVTTNEDLALHFGCSPRTIVRRAREMGLGKDARWLQDQWDANRLKAHRANKILHRQQDLTAFIEGGKPYRFTTESHMEVSPEERHRRIVKAWETRRSSTNRKRRNYD